MSAPATMPRTHVYAGSPLDRVGAQREDAAWVAAQLASPEALFVPVWRGGNLLRGAASGPPEAVFLPPSAALPAEADAWALLGLDAGRPVFAVDLSRADVPLDLLGLAGTDAPNFEDLRWFGGALPPRDAAILAHARGLMHWQTHHRFCAVCGAACQPKSAGHVMACTGCGADHFPRTDPAVIMLVTRDDRALLGHSRRFGRSRMFSTLAGFVEPGESLEEAVAREVLEEAGIRVGAITYHSSQPWPFPASIMIGFHAEALSEAISIDTTELTEARWFTRDALRAPASQDFDLPPRASIARQLIEHWLATA